MNKLCIVATLTVATLSMLCPSCKKQDESASPRYRVLISTDIGGTDPDDNQSMLHLLMYANEFDLEGLVSSPSYGKGSKEEILRMIDEYEQDLPQLKEGLAKMQAEDPTLAKSEYPTADELRSITKQGKRDEASMKGWDKPTEGSEWIIRCAHSEDPRPLYVLVWGCLEDVAQALHDDPSIQEKIRVYWIGGPNKKWGANAYTYVAENFPDLWMIENNSSYRGFLGSNQDSSYYQAGLWENCMKGHGVIGNDFVNYYKGIAKMGDTPSLLYMMPGEDKAHPFDPADPTQEHWGGQFEKMTTSPKYIVTGPLTLADTLQNYAVMEWQLKGPEVGIPYDSVAFTMTVDRQTWRGHYMGNGLYMVRYAPKQPATLHYVIESPIPNFPVQEGDFVVESHWPAIGEYHTSSPTISSVSIPLGDNWWTDIQDETQKGGVADYEETAHQRDKWQGAGTISKWRDTVMKDWEKRFEWVK